LPVARGRKEKESRNSSNDFLSGTSFGGEKRKEKKREERSSAQGEKRGKGKKESGGRCG